jgi:hypothetical protein
MIWIFERAEESLRLETRYDNDTTEYVLILHYPDGSDQTERFSDSAAFQTRLDSLDRTLARQNWQYVGAPVLLPDGWKV